MTGMILVVHIMIAVTSVLYTAYILLAPTKKKIQLSGRMVAATIASGTILVVSAQANMVQSCITGLLYTGVMFFALAIAKWRLAEESEKIG
mgnify:CR=1 FL=1